MAFRGKRPSITTDRDHGEKEVLRTVDQLKSKPHVTIGIQEDTGKAAHGEGGVTVLQVATWNEFGTMTAGGEIHIPERSFIRATVDKNMQVYLQLVEQLHKKVILRQMTVEEALSLLGEKIQADIQNEIAAGIDPENAPSTIARKGSSTPLIDSGQLRQSIRYKVYVNGGFR